MDKVLVLGKGFLGREFERQGFTVWGRDKFEYNRTIDGKKHGKSSWFIYDRDEAMKYDVVINTIGMTSTRACEKNPQEALNVNGHLVESLHRIFEHAKFVQISTGCLYDNYLDINTEEAFVSAHCAYTVSKWVGEMSCDKTKDLIIRPRLLFGSECVPQNFLYRLQSYKYAVEDRQDSFTSIIDLVSALKNLIAWNAVGIYNVANSGSLSVKEVCDLLGIKDKEPVNIKRIRQTEGIYLVNNVMDISKLKIGYYPRGIKEALKEEFNKMKRETNEASSK